MLSRGAAEAAAADAARALREGLRALSTTAAAHVDAANALDKRAKEYAAILARDRARFEEERAALEAERAQLEAERASFEKERSRNSSGAVAEVPGEDTRSVQDVYSTTVPEETSIQFLRSPAPMLALGELQVARQAESGARRREEKQAPPSSARTMPRSVTPRAASALEYDVTIGDYTYTVLPPRAVGDSRPSHDMVGQVVSVPERWEVLSTQVEGFDMVIRSLAASGWGALRLCVRDPEARGGFSNYSTSLRPFSVPGEKLVGDKYVLEEAFSDVDSRFKFTDDLVSGRLVIRRHWRADGARG